MAALARVWLCTEECSFVLAERITALAVRSPEGGPLTRMPDGEVRVGVRTGGEEAPYTTVATCSSELAPGLLADLAQVLTDAADYPEPCAFVHLGRSDDGAPEWTISSTPPENWPG